MYATTSIYEDIAARSAGDIYIGVVGPVRTGKSTFIKRFMELMVLPAIDNRYKRERATDELPQSGAGRSVMTCEPKFVPAEAVRIVLSGQASANIRLIDCVGYLVPGALGASEDGSPRMITTPWDDKAMPFERAAEIGTRKVIAEHSTIGIVVTTDASFGELARENYVEAEMRVTAELKAQNKPFIVVLNTIHPYAAETMRLKSELEEKYLVPVIAIDVLNMQQSDIEGILSSVCSEFPVSRLSFRIPRWAAGLRRDSWIMAQIEEFIQSTASKNEKIRCVTENIQNNVCENFEARIENIDLKTGCIETNLYIDPSVFYRIIGEENGITIKSESDMFALLTELLAGARRVEQINAALRDQAQTGYAIITPEINDMKLSPPERTNDGGRHGVRISASAEAVHMLRSVMNAEINPIIGSEAECAAFFETLAEKYESSPAELLSTEIFGRTIADMLSDNIRVRLSGISDEHRERLVRLISKISNTKKGGLVVFWI